MSDFLAGIDCQVWPRLQGASTAPPIVSMLFERDPERFTHCSAQAAGLLLDYSRQRVDGPLLSAFSTLAEQLGLRQRIEEMFTGAPINQTEGRAVLHTALRRPASAGALIVEGTDLQPLILAERKHMLGFADAIRGGTIRSSKDLPFNLVVNIGIGGSDLGPAMAVRALRTFTRGAPRVEFVSNIDGCELVDLLEEADPARTLFIICSKTFTTLETRTNAEAARKWLRERLGDAAIPGHFAAVSVNAKAMDAFGVHPDYRFNMWDWVGGRYSIWSSIGVALAIAVGAEQFSAFLAGAHQLDEHFRTAPWEQNLPALAAFYGIWNIDFLKLPTLAILPYDSRLARLPAYLQQLEMESNGKSVRLNGEPTAVATCPVIWGEPGDNAQHSFFQLLHQGSERAALDMLVPVRSSGATQEQQDLAIASALAQAEAFAFGHSAEQVVAELQQQGLSKERIAALTPHKVHAGNRPVSLVLFRELDPRTLGAIIALYEHKVFVQSVVWGNNAFDQWGVELGKKMCDAIIPLVKDPQLAGHATSSVRGALAFVSRERGT
jgi:glucose-6-phosphate isomerase